MADRPAYQSEAYYNIVFGAEKLKGWRNIYAGDGTLVFEHDSGKQADFFGGASKGWLERAWDQFTAMVATKEA
jgi:hypothetical protein